MEQESPQRKGQRQEDVVRDRGQRTEGRGQVRSGQVRYQVNPSGTECWRIEHDATTIWQRVSVEDLVK